MIDGNEKTFWVTTGMFPHELLLGFKGSAATISKVRLWSYHIRKLTIEKCVTRSPGCPRGTANHLTLTRHCRV